MTDDSVTLNIASVQGAPLEETVLPAGGVAASRRISNSDIRDNADQQLHDREPERKKPVVEVATFEQLEAKIVAANARLQHQGIAVTLSLHRDEEEAIHLEIEDRRTAERTIVHRHHIIEHDEITQLINDILEEIGICVDETA